MTRNGEPSGAAPAMHTIVTSWPASASVAASRRTRLSWLTSAYRAIAIRMRAYRSGTPTEGG